jgi:hypothetical protein
MENPMTDDKRLSNVTPITDALWARWKQLIDDEGRGIAAIRANRLEQGRIAKELRDLYPSNVEFGNECNRHAFLANKSQQEISDLIWLASLTDVARGNLWHEFPEVTSAEWLRRKTREKFGADYLYDVSSTEPSVDAPSIPSSPESSPASADTAESDLAPEQKVGNQESGSVLTKRSALAHIQRGEELASVFRSEKARTMLGNFPKQRGGKYILSLVLEALDAGLIPPNDLQPHQPTLSLLFPLAPIGFVRSYRLDNPKLRPQIRKMLDTMIACRPKLLAEPHRIREILADYEAEQKAKIRAEVDSKRRNDAIAQLVSGQQELIMFGTTVWPRLDDKQGPYDYDQIRAAIWTFRDQLAWNKITNDNSPGSIGIRIRLSMKWYNEYLMRVDPLRESPCRRVFNLVFWLSKLYEAAPDAECKWPAYPTAEAEW